MDSFLMACRANAPLTLEIETPDVGPERREFAQPFALIGRDDRADLRLDHEQVSRRHAYLQVINGCVFAIDLDSRTGIGSAGWLRPGDALMVGPFTIRLISPGNEGGRDESSAPSPLQARSTPQDGLPSISLEFQSGSSGQSVWRMSQALVLVGKSNQCKVRLLDPSISKVHCALIRTSEGLWVLDLLSRIGITVNGEATRWVRLGPGDQLGLGQVIFRPKFGDEPVRPDESRSLARPSGPNPTSPATRPAAGFPEQFDANRGSTALHANADDPSLALLLNHFGQMQQQMLDQFQQSMLMMMQMFGGMHREQMGLVREELDRLRELTEEMQSIKARLADRPAAPFVPSVSLGQRWGTSPTVPGSTAPSPPPQPSAAPEARKSPNGPLPPFSAVTPGENAGVSSKSPAPEVRPEAAPKVAPVPNGDVHGWLNERLAALEKEQQTRMQKIMKLIRGGG